MRIIARPGLLAEPQKIIFDLQLADLAVEFADLGFVGLVVPLAAVLEHAPSSFFQAWIWLGWTPYSPASSPTALDRHRTPRISIRARRKQAAWNDDYMLSLLAGWLISCVAPGSGGGKCSAQAMDEGAAVHAQAGDEGQDHRRDAGRQQMIAQQATG